MTDDYDKLIYHLRRVFRSIHAANGAHNGEHTISFQAGDVQKSLHVHIDDTDLELYASDETGLLRLGEDKE